MRLFPLLAVLLPGAVLLSACAAPRPVLYPNAKLNLTGQAAADAAVAECRRRADASDLDSSQGRVVKGAAGGAVAGAIVGAAVGSVSGNAGKGAQYGAAGGAAHGGVRGLFRGRDPGPIYKAYVNRCLSESGYEVIGWQ
jgi:outer membrane lipoprotein SlyB